MRPPSGTIDLGELPHGDEFEILQPRPLRARLRRWRTRRTWRVAGAAAATALVLVAAAAAAARPQPPLTLQFTIQGAGYTAAADERHLYVFDGTGDPSTTVVAAYRLTDGSLAWRTWLPGEQAELGLWDEVLLVTAHAASPEERLPTERTSRLDPDSGSTLWTIAGWPAGRIDDRLLFSHSTTYVELHEHSRTTLTAIDLETGDEAWSIDANRWDYGAGRAATRLVTLDSEGTLTAYDPTTGELRASAPTTAPTEPAQDVYWNALQILGSTVFLTEELDGEFVLSAYDAATLQRQWTLAADPALNMWPTACGDLVCLNAEREVPRAVDPGSGRTVWTADWLPPIPDEGAYHLYDPGIPELAGYAVMSRSIWQASDGGSQRSWLVDLDTGTPVLDLGHWTFSSGPMWLTGSPGGMMTLNTETGTWIGRLRQDLSGIDALDRIEGATRNEFGYGTYCAPSPTLVVCFTDELDGGELAHPSLEVWRLR